MTARATLQAIYGRLSRTTSGGKTIGPIDGLRGLAIGAVFLFHLQVFMCQQWVGWTQHEVSPQLERVLAAGQYGVQLFFVISGFILALPFIAQHVGGSAPVNLRRYYLRRLTRIEPPFLASLALCACVAYFVRHWSLEATLRRLAANAAYLHGALYGDMSPLTPVAWSLEVEVQFYLLAPLLGLLFAIPGRKLRRTVMGGLGVAFVCVKALYIAPGTALAFSLVNYVAYFLAGFLLADLYVERQQEPAHGAWDLVCFIGTPLLCFGFARWPKLVHALPLALLLLCHAALHGPNTRRLLSFRPLMTAGGMCYSIYLLHLQLIYIFGHFTKGVRLGSSFTLNLLVQLLLVGLPTLLVCIIFFLVIEKPCMAGARIRKGGSLRPLPATRVKCEA